MIVLSLLCFQSITCLVNGLGKTPQMGWNSWNKFGCNIHEDLIKRQADALITSGLFAKGYNYLNLDDCWQLTRDPETKKIKEDEKAFPNGIKHLADYAHDKGLKFGLYSDAGLKTCQERPGSLGYEEIDAKTYAEWGVDYLKYDNCFDDGRSPKVRYPPMSDALLNSGREIFFSMCEWGVEDPATWAGELGNSWRTTGDIFDTWKSFTEILDKQYGLEKYAKPGAWNDPDMLEVGNGGMTDNEYQAHFALWALLKAPLIIGCDVENMTEKTLEILGNEAIIAINQDPLGIQGRRISRQGDLEVYAGPVINGHIVILFNRSDKAQEISADFDEVEYGYQGAYLTDLVTKQKYGYHKGKYTTSVPSHSVVVLRLDQACEEEGFLACQIE